MLRTSIVVELCSGSRIITEETLVRQEFVRDTNSCFTRVSSETLPDPLASAFSVKDLFWTWERPTLLAGQPSGEGGGTRETPASGIPGNLRFRRAFCVLSRPLTGLLTSNS